MRNSTVENKFKSSILFYIAAFIFIIIIGYLPLWKNGLSVIWNVDGVGQYYPTFLYIGQYLRDFINGIFHGEMILPVWDLSIGLGEDIIGVLNYYGFADPLNLLSIFATSNTGGYIYTICFFLRLWLAGYTFQLYCHEMDIDTIASTISSFCYVFCGFAVYGGGRYIEWLSVLVYFPLLLLGAEKIIKGAKSTRVLILSTLYAALCGFYYLYMSCLCLVIYCFVRLISRHCPSVKVFLQKSFALILNFLLGLFLAAPVFLSEVSAYFNSERITHGSSVERILFNITNYIPRLNKSLIAVVFNFLHDQRQNLSGILVIELLALVLLFLIHSRKACQLKIAVFITVIALHLPITGWIFNGLGETNDRWCFWIHFLFAVILAYVLTIFSTSTINIAKNDVRYIGKRSLTIVLFALVAGNIIVNLWLLHSNRIYSKNWKKEMIAYRSLEKYVNSPVNCSSIIAKDDSLFRVTNDSLTNINGRPENVAMLNDYYGTTWWFSIINAYTQTYANMVAQRSLKWRSYGLCNNLIYEAFAGVKYYVSNKKENNNNEYVLVEQIMFNGDTWNVYKNPYYFGMAYLRNRKIADKLLRGKKNYKTYEAYYRQLLTLFKQEPIIDVTYSKSRNSFICAVSSKEDEELVLLIPYHKNWRAYVDNKEAKVKKTDMMYVSIPLGEGEHTVVLKYESTAMKIGFVLLMVGIACCAQMSINFKKRN